MTGNKKEPRTRVVEAPAPESPRAQNRVLSVVLGEDEEVEWEWSRTPEGHRIVSGYRIVKREADEAA